MQKEGNGYSYKCRSNVSETTPASRCRFAFLLRKLFLSSLKIDHWQLAVYYTVKTTRVGVKKKKRESLKKNIYTDRKSSLRPSRKNAVQSIPKANKKADARRTADD